MLQIRRTFGEHGRHGRSYTWSSVLSSSPLAAPIHHNKNRSRTPTTELLSDISIPHLEKDWTCRIYTQNAENPDESLYLLVLERCAGDYPIRRFQVNISLRSAASDMRDLTGFIKAATFFQEPSFIGGNMVDHELSGQQKEKFESGQEINSEHVTWTTDGILGNCAFAIILRPGCDPFQEALFIQCLGKFGDATTTSSFMRASRAVPFNNPVPAPSAMIWAAAHGWKDGLNQLSREPIGVIGSVDSSGRTALSWAAGNGQVEATEFLLGKIDVNKGDHNGRTPLSWAAGNGQEDILQLLRSRGAMWQEDRQRRSELWWAAESGHDIVVEELLEIPELRTRIKEDLINLDHSCKEDLSPIAIAAKKKHIRALRILIAKAFQLSKMSHEAGLASKFLRFWLRRSAVEGWLELLQVMMDSNEVKDPQNEYSEPLCISAAKGWTRIVEILLVAGAHRNSKCKGDTALCLAVKNGHEGVVRVLLQAGANIYQPNDTNDTPHKLSLDHENQTILAMLNEADEEGRLAENMGSVNSTVDQHFKAKLALFEYRPGGLKFLPSERRVKDLWEQPLLPRVTTYQYFQWIHLPANNMRWVELLLVKLYGTPAKAYQVLKPERWVRRQHRGDTAKPHARFMRPYCQSLTDVEGSTAGDKNRVDAVPSSPSLVLFVPYLHWDVNHLRLERQTSLENGVKEPQGVEGKAESDLVNVYSNSTHHSLHIRRTLDQYYYHTLTDTQKRDDSQVPTRYQTNRGLDANIITMVDQLWVWVIASKGHPDIVISCFPRVGDYISLDVHPDQYRRTDIFENIKLQLLEEPGSVTCAYDLVGLIAAKCSRIYLDPASTVDLSKDHRGVQFSEMYEDAIGDIMQKETDSFDEFKSLSQNPPAEDTLADIKEEILWLSYIKDVLDELNIQEVLFEAQKKQFQCLDQIVRSTSPEDTALDGSPQVKYSLSKGDGVSKVRTGDNEDHPVTSSEEHTRSCEQDSIGEASEPFTKIGPIWMQGENGLLLNHVNSSIEEVRGMTERANRVYKSLNFLIDLKLKYNNVIDSKKALKLTEETAKLTQSIHGSTDQTKNAVKETATLAQKADKQGSTIMVFTVVTIIFLPLSFMTTMFQLDIRQYKKVDGKLDLGYVSAIIFPISTLISALLIWVAFRAGELEEKLSQIFNRERGQHPQV